jgi:hypothetical protein
MLFIRLDYDFFWYTISISSEYDMNTPEFMYLLQRLCCFPYVSNPFPNLVGDLKQIYEVCNRKIMFRTPASRALRGWTQCCVGKLKIFTVVWILARVFWHVERGGDWAGNMLPTKSWENG